LNIAICKLYIAICNLSSKIEPPYKAQIGSQLHASTARSIGIS
jgi:hypothetical protein